MTLRPIPESIMQKVREVCPTCKGSDIIRYGKRKGVQVYKCKPCQQKFTDNGALPGRRVPPNQVGTAISLFYSGMSLSEIARQLEDIYEIPPPSTASIYEWTVDYTRLAQDMMKNHKATTGDEWVADEMQVKVGGQAYWNFNVMDSMTRYILASHLSKNRGTRDAMAVFEKAKANAATIPKTIKTDGLKSYIDGIEQVFGADTKHVTSKGIRAEINNNLSERLQGTFRARVKILRGLHRKETGQLFLDGWVINYNLFRPHESIKKTPAEAAKIGLKFEEWEDFAKHDVRPYSKARVIHELKFRQPRRATVLKRRALAGRKGL